MAYLWLRGVRGRLSFGRLAPLLGKSGILLFPFGRCIVREPIARVDRLPKLRDEIVELIR